MHWLLLIAVIPYFIILLRIFSDLKKIKNSPLLPGPFTRISVVIPCRNESGKIGNLLVELSGQTLPASYYELIFVDDNSTDDTGTIIKSYCESKGITNVKIISGSGRGKKAAISEGVKAAVNQLIVTTDADCRPGPLWLSTISGFSNNYKPDLIICPVKLGEKKGFFGGFQGLEFMSLQGVTAATAAAHKPTMCNGANLAFREEAYLRNLRNLRQDIASGDDIFLLQALKKERENIMWLESQDACVTADPVPDIKSYLEQRKRWISKGRYYKDSLTIALGIVTFVTIIVQIFSLLAGFANQLFWLVWLAVFMLKSIPDYLILYNTCTRYNNKDLLRWFLPAQVVYPFYVLAVLFYPEGEWRR